MELFSPHIVSISPSRVFTPTDTHVDLDSTIASSKNNGSPYWGLNRINSYERPPEGSTYTPEYTDEGVNVFVVDSGIDTTHVEFSGNSARTVSNVFDITAGKKRVAANNDYMGHGTHCAGVIGGRTVGVAPSANLLGVKVMGRGGEGTDEGILRGLEFVYDAYQQAGRQPRTVISMV